MGTQLDSTEDEYAAQQSPSYPIDSAIATDLAELFKALSDPSRVRIISALLHSEMCVNDLAAMLSMSQSAVSHQLRSLRDKHLVRFRRDGRRVFYQLDDQHIYELFIGGLEHVLHNAQ